MPIEGVRPTKVWAYFKEKGIRVSGEAKPKIMELLNQTLAGELDKIIDKLPKFSKGQKKGEIKRKTIKAEDL
ncbi:MAG: hypothetical protein HWN66_02720 [Candidatus Helarchaeota archaeon]|nr:hypothetical protein [Candidatus Helarchaeota archaeon]